MNDSALARRSLNASADTSASVSAVKPGVDTALASAIYEGNVRHRRHAPHAHAFTYRVAMLYLDLGEIDRVFAGRWLWSVERANVVSFQRRDYLGDRSRALDECVRDAVEKESGHRPLGPVRLLTHLRTFGYSFNPVSFYYCYEADGSTLNAIVAEVTNTPWKQRHAYVMPVADGERRGRAWRWQFDKRMHVSPFMAMQHDYDWRFTPPGEGLHVHMDVLRRGDNAGSEFDATLMLERRPINSASLARVLWRYPLMTTRIVTAIHWQALRLLLRGNPVHTHPDKKVSPR